jgi:hypothetical protein
LDIVRSAIVSLFLNNFYKISLFFLLQKMILQQGVRFYPQHRTVPYRTVPYRTVPYRTVPYRTVPYRTVPYRTVPYRTVPYRTVPYRTVPYRTVPYRTLPFSVTIFITLAVSKREAYRFFCLKFSVFPLKKSKARTVLYLKLRPF